MATEDEVYFPLTGTEGHGYIRVRLFDEAGTMKAEATLEGSMTSETDQEGLPIQGEPKQVLHEVNDLASVRGLDVRIQLDGVEWNPGFGTLLENEADNKKPAG